MSGEQPQETKGGPPPLVDIEWFWQTTGAAVWIISLVTIPPKYVNSLEEASFEEDSRLSKALPCQLVAARTISASNFLGIR